MLSINVLLNSLGAPVRDYKAMFQGQSFLKELPGVKMNNLYGFGVMLFGMFFGNSCLTGNWLSQVSYGNWVRTSIMQIALDHIRELRFERWSWQLQQVSMFFSPECVAKGSPWTLGGPQRSAAVGLGTILERSSSLVSIALWVNGIVVVFWWDVLVVVMLS